MSGPRFFSGVGMPALPSWPSMRRRAGIVVALFFLLLAGYMLWFRDSSFVQIETVEVTGAEGAPNVVADLTTAAVDMSTLHVDRNALFAAVADDPAVLSLTTDVDFPHGLTIAVDLRLPAGYVDADGGAVVAADGVILATGLERPDDLPMIDADSSTLGQNRVEGSAATAARVLGFAPVEMMPLVESATVDGDGSPVVTLDGGIELRFGTPAQADLKWRAAATVLADPGVDVASYIDLSVPSRPVLG